MAVLKVLTARSASPLDDGWYGTEKMCLIPFFFRKV
jgi:hypothetical protein